MKCLRICPMQFTANPQEANHLLCPQVSACADETKMSKQKFKIKSKWKT